MSCVLKSHRYLKSSWMTCWNRPTQKRSLENRDSSVSCDVCFESRTLYLVLLVSSFGSVASFPCTNELHIYFNLDWRP